MSTNNSDDTQKLLETELAAFALYAAEQTRMEDIVDAAVIAGNWRKLTEEERASFRKLATTVHSVVEVFCPNSGYFKVPSKKLCAALQDIITIPAKQAYDLPLEE